MTSADAVQLAPADRPPSIGSFVLFEAASVEEIRAIIEDDVYYKTDVVRRLMSSKYTAADIKLADYQWDKEKLELSGVLTNKVPWA